LMVLVLIIYSYINRKSLMPPPSSQAPVPIEKVQEEKNLLVLQEISELLEERDAKKKNLPESEKEEDAILSPPPEKQEEDVLAPDKESQISIPNLLPEPAPLPVAAENQDIGSFALEHFGYLDKELFHLLQETNPHIKDWNSINLLDEISLPDLPVQFNKNVDFYSVQVASFRSQPVASLTVKALAKKGFQNLFLIEGELNPTTGKRWFRCCVGVFGISANAGELKKRMMDMGFYDAFTTRIQGKPLQKILQIFPPLNLDKEQERPEEPFHEP